MKHVCCYQPSLCSLADIGCYFKFLVPPTIKEVTSSADKSWIGQTVSLKCVSDGVPTPTLTWYKPGGSQINSVTATQITVDVKMNVDQDFDGYKCVADNKLAPADFETVKIEQISRSFLSKFLNDDVFCTVF